VLLTAYGPPGRETGVRQALRRILRGTGTFSEDAIGNLHLRTGGNGARLLITAHMDAPGIIVTKVDSGTGAARLGILGGRRASELVGATVRFEDGRLAVVTTDRAGGKDGDMDADALSLEGGAGAGRSSGRKRTASPNGTRGARLEVGDVAGMDDRPTRLGDLWCAANLDNRAGCAALAAALRTARRSRFDVTAVFAAQSDLGSRGATTAAFGAEPELAIVIDVAHVGDNKETSGFAVGKGPGLALKESGFLAHPDALELVRRAARAAKTPLQYLIRENEGSDARAIRMSRSGVPTAMIAIPARRSGGLWSLVHANDLAQVSQLISAILTLAPKGAGSPSRRPRRGKGGRR
jgi:endoglucanase